MVSVDSILSWLKEFSDNCLYIRTSLDGIHRNQTDLSHWYKQVEQLIRADIGRVHQGSKPFNFYNVILDIYQIYVQRDLIFKGSHQESLELQNLIGRKPKALWNERKEIMMDKYEQRVLKIKKQKETNRMSEQMITTRERSKV